MKAPRIVKLITVSMILLIMSGCGLTVGKIQRNCDKFMLICKPEPNIIIKDSIVNHSVIIFRDTTIILPGDTDTVYQKMPIYVTSGKKPLFTKDTLTIHNRYSTASAWITDNFLHISLYQDSAIHIHLKNALRDANYYRYQYTREVEKNNTGISYWWILFVVFGGIICYFLVKRKII